ncbi:hypothetical protein [uncultured Corynebacterium sp.]|uniref:hypothetical protein n=1 Tax=uncultured Corynebacterium sp. TaxID=159447 RepID=UPI002591DC62|nr:hypothetical protein [uncultured Corynebacterium sp.]
MLTNESNGVTIYSDEDNHALFALASTVVSLGTDQAYSPRDARKLAQLLLAAADAAEDRQRHLDSEQARENAIRLHDLSDSLTEPERRILNRAVEGLMLNVA